AFVELFVFIAELLNARRRQPPGDDLVGLLLEAEGSGGDTLTAVEIAAFCMLLLVAGNETTTSLLGNTLAALLANRDQLDLLRRRRPPLPGRRPGPAGGRGRPAFPAGAHERLRARGRGRPGAVPRPAIGVEPAPRGGWTMTVAAWRYHSADEVDEARERILDAAEAAVQRWGVARTRIDDVATEARCGRTTIYRYFGNRD